MKIHVWTNFKSCILGKRVEIIGSSFISYPVDLANFPKLVEFGKKKTLGLFSVMSKIDIHPRVG